MKKHSTCFGLWLPLLTTYRVLLMYDMQWMHCAGCQNQVPSSCIISFNVKDARKLIKRNIVTRVTKVETTINLTIPQPVLVFTYILVSQLHLFLLQYNFCTHRSNRKFSTTKIKPHTKNEKNGKAISPIFY